MNIAILTPVKVEFEAILAHLPGAKEQIKEKRLFYTAKFKGKFQKNEVILLQTGMGNEQLALSADSIARLFHPDVIFLAGIAGGVKDVQIGDIVIGTKYYGYEYGKITPDGFSARPESGAYSLSLQTLAKSVANQKQWLKHLTFSNGKRPSVFFGAIAAGNKVVADSRSEAIQIIKKSYGDTIALEMEAAGFGRAMHAFPEIQCLNIRSVSDMLDGKGHTDEDGSQEVAARHMAAFVMEMIAQLDKNQIVPMKFQKRKPSQNRDRNLPIGEIIHLHLEKEHAASVDEFDQERLEEIKAAISKGRVEQAIDQILGYASAVDSDIFNESISIARQYESLQRDIRIGILSTDEKFRLINKITFNLLNVADTLYSKANR